VDAKLVKEIFLLHDQVCAALGNPHRLLILYTLRMQPRYVTDMAAELDMPQSSVSRHLKVLRDCGLVVTRRAGPAVYYELADSRVIEALELLRALMSDRLQQQARITRLISS
jgi:ArsR family transcriptional regulator